LQISQLLGHNEHLYMKLPRGWWAWHFAMATCLTAEGALLVFFPSTARQLLFPSLVASLAAASGPIEAETSAEINLQLSTAHQCHGAALLGENHFHIVRTRLNGPLELSNCTKLATNGGLEGAACVNELNLKRKV
jgi:Tumour protein p53-inducible protein 11